MRNLSTVLFKQEDYSGARLLEQEALEASRRVLGQKHPDASAAAWNLFCTLGRLREREARHAVLWRDLVWLVDEDPESLGLDQRQIRYQISKYLERNPDDM